MTSSTQPSASQSPVPVVAEDIARFSGSGGTAAVLNYDVPLPGRFTGRRLIHLDLDLEPADVDPAAAALTDPVARLGWQQKDQDSSWTYNAVPARDLWFQRADAAWSFPDTVGDGFSIVHVPGEVKRQAFEALRSVAYSKPLKDDGTLQNVTHREVWLAAGNQPLPPSTTNPDFDPYSLVPYHFYFPIRLYNRFVDGLGEGRLRLPARTWSDQVQEDEVTAEATLSTSVDDIHFFIVEIYGISSFLEDYGLGKTIRTFTLLPGEETKISMKTWRTDTAKEDKSTSIVDSYDEKSAKRFNTAVVDETTDRSTRNNKLSWHAEAEVSAGWGWGSAKVSAGAAGENQSAREEFAKRVANAVQEHTADAASNRTNSVSLSTETVSTTGSESASERTVRNINLRRVLNFVFRELNQRYVTKVHLIETRVAFATSTTFSFQEVPVAGLRSLLDRVFKPGRSEDVARSILAAIGTVVDATGTPVRTLERLDVAVDGSYRASEAGPDPQDGTWEPPPASGEFLYRWRGGPLNQRAGKPTVPGVLMNETEIVMPTSDLVVEALLGEADALDEYAYRSQQEDLESKRLENRKLELALEILEAIQDPAARAAAYADMFNRRAADPSSGVR